ncbi:lactoylglutathione lyase [Leptospira hartskeerlii]|uniref:Aldoketomutase n=1 Tax=Leptospira hartskeerlii TaxID=2023177 RepID=A0A2M9XII8_9LEPT|nr:VOC family protein [Leptospira hartskeerlii]PJZ27508.1 lactoylglutathione lyase [Leptospira hartskeerlii]PJZ32365.1 lactoylglutathione lyase [Leptospira hartskeerlii]
MKYLHAMIRVKDLDQALDFFCNKLGLKETRRHDHPEGRYTLVFLSELDRNSPEIELTYNWDQDSAYTSGRNFGHLAFEVDNIYETCANLQAKGVIINRPPRDGRMAFIRSPDLISIELLQRGKSLEIAEPWKSMSNTGEW